MRLLRIARSAVVGWRLGRHPDRATGLRPLRFDGLEPPLDHLDEARRQELGTLVDDATIAELADHLDRGTLSAVELTTYLLDRLRRLDPHLGSALEVDPAALADAAASDERRRGGRTLGPLDGIGVTVKGNIAVRPPLRTSAGAVVLADHVAGGDAPLVAALRAAGAVVLGTANLSELAGAVSRRAGFSAVGGPTRNPFGDQHSPGGSSSGSAVGVAAGTTVASVGTETSGSLIAPAAFNGVVAVKPTHGLVDGDGVVPLVAAQDTPGPIARCVADAATVLAAIAGDAVDPGSLSDDALRGVAVGVLEDDIVSQRSPFEDTADNGAILARIVDGLRAAGAAPRSGSIADPEARARFEAGATKVVLGGLTHDTVAHLAGAGAPVRTLDDLHAFNLAEPATRMPSGQFVVDLALFSRIDRRTYESAAAEHRRIATELLDATFAAIGVDVLASLTNRHSMLYATAGYPAVTVPVGFRASGMPTGVTLIGRAGDDQRLLGWAHAFEQATRLRVRPVLPDA